MLDAQGQRVWHDEDEVVEAIVLLRKGDQSLPALDDIHALVQQLNETPGRLLPGVKIEPYYDRTELIHVTTGTVQENLLAGMGLVTVVLLLFLSNVRTALIVALNIPLALLFAFAVLFLRGKSANLLSIGAVDFGIIVDSSVIMVENIYRHLSSGVDADLPIDQRILRASGEVQRSLTFSTAIMVCAFLPLFTMAGPEGQIFGPMADTYAFALAGALLLGAGPLARALRALAAEVKPRPDNWLVRTLQAAYRRQLERCLRHRVLTLGLFALVVAATAAVIPMLGREFLPELEEGNLWIAGTFPLKSSLDEVCEGVEDRAPTSSNATRSAKKSVSEVGRPDDGTDPAGFYGTENYVPLKPHDAVADPPRPDPPPHQGRAGRRPESRDLRNAGGHGMELLAEHPQQRQRNALRRSRRQLREDHRARPGGAGKHRRPRGPRPAEGPRPGECRGVPHPGPVEPEPAGGPRQVRAVEPQRQRRAGGGRYGRGRQGLQPDDRGRTELRHHLALPPRPAIEPGRDPRHPGRGEQEHGGQQPVQRTGGYARQRPHHRHFAHRHQRRAAAADRFELQRPHERPEPHPARPARATWSRRWAPTAGSTSTAPSCSAGPRTSTASGASG